MLAAAGTITGLLTLLDTLDEKTLILEIAERPDFLDGKILRDILQQNCKYQNDQFAAMQRQNREYREFLEAWVHEIKTPITSGEAGRRKRKDPPRLCASTIHCAALTTLSSSYSTTHAAKRRRRISRSSARRCRRWSARRSKSYSKPIIQAGGRVELMGLDLPVPADTKSCAFVIGAGDRQRDQIPA